MYPYLFKYGAFKVSSYGVMLALAFIVGVWVAKRLGEKDGITEQQIDSISLWLIVAGVIGSRFLYTFVEHYDDYIQKPVRFFYFQEGGLSFSGGLVFAIVAAVLFCKKHRLSFWKMADCLSPSLALGFAIAKIGCFLMGCCHGSACTVPWGISYNHPESLAHPKGTPLHPSQIYECLAMLVVFALLLICKKRKTFEGQVFLSLIVLYGVVRSLLEFFRGDTGHLGILTTAQAINLPLIIGAIILWIMMKKKGQSHLPD